jgi:hypothetical protein
MANRAQRRRSMKINELREQAVEAMNQSPYFDIEVETGEIFRIWHPLLQDDEAQKRIDRINAGEDLDKDDDGRPLVPNRVKSKLAEPFTVRTARAIMGEADHKKFIAAGGRSNDVQLAWNEMVRQYEEELGDEADPKSD